MALLIRWFPGVLAGAALATGLILACSDDSPRDADAAMCDCPATEPPLAGRIVESTQLITIAANGGGSNAAGCPAGATLLGGGCTIEVAGAGVGTITQYESGPRNAGGPGYSCQWTSTIPNASMGKATAICLVPAT